MPKLSNHTPTELQSTVSVTYDCPCIGSVYGCPEKTNGSQYCCKYFCPLELDHTVNVEAEQPEISLTEQDYQYNMSFIGKVSVDGIRSRDELDLLVAYVGDEPRGMANPMYIEDYDAYFIFMSVYSNELLGEEVNFRLWDASEGKIQSQVRINGVQQIDFVDGSTRILFEGNDLPEKIRSSSFYGDPLDQLLQISS